MGSRGFKHPKTQTILKAMAGIKAASQPAGQLQKTAAPAAAAPTPVAATPAAPAPKAPAIGGYTPLAGHVSDPVTSYKRKPKTKKPIQVKAKMRRQLIPKTSPSLGMGLN